MKANEKRYYDNENMNVDYVGVLIMNLFKKYYIMPCHVIFKSLKLFMCQDAIFVRVVVLIGTLHFKSMPYLL